MTSADTAGAAMCCWLCAYRGEGIQLLSDVFCLKICFIFLCRKRYQPGWKHSRSHICPGPVSQTTHESVHGCIGGRDKECQQEEKLCFIPLLRKRCQAESQRLAYLVTVMYSLSASLYSCSFVQVEFSYPPLKPGEGHDSHGLPEEWKYLPFLALPDGAHNYQEGKKQERKFYVLLLLQPTILFTVRLPVLFV